MVQIAFSDHSPVRWSTQGHCGSFTSAAASYTTITSVNLSSSLFYCYFSARNTTGYQMMSNTATTRTVYLSASSITDSTITVRYKHVSGGKCNWIIVY